MELSEVNGEIQQDIYITGIRANGSARGASPILKVIHKIQTVFGSYLDRRSL